MAHDCPECGALCYCDGEDHGQAAPDDCEHKCVPEDDSEYYDEDGRHLAQGLGIVTQIETQ